MADYQPRWKELGFSSEAEYEQLTPEQKAELNKAYFQAKSSWTQMFNEGYVGWGLAVIALGAAASLSQCGSEANAATNPAVDTVSGPAAYHASPRHHGPQIDIRAPKLVV